MRTASGCASSAFTDEGREMVRNMHAGLFAFESDRGMEDYVYNADDLRNLTGRKYQPKRNHINRFMAEYPDFRYEQLTRERFGECMQLEREWRRAHEGHTSELCAEQRAMQRAFEHFEELEMLGGCIYVGDRLIAFTYGSAVNDHTFDTHVEKADTDYDGAFTIINKLFAQHLPARFTMINREEDLRIDGLRQSKLSYHPAVIQHKYAAIHLHPDEIACKELWTAAFGDDEQFVDSFLMRYYSRRRMLTAECEGRTAAMLHLVPFESELGRSTYIYGVATAPEFRRRGLAGKLMREAMRLIGEQGDEAAFLIPERGVAARVLCKIRLRRRCPGDILIARRLRFPGRATPRKTGPWSGGEPRGSAARGTALHLRQEVASPCCAATQGAISHPRQESRRLYSLRLSVLHIVTQSR